MTEFLNKRRSKLTVTMLVLSCLFVSLFGNMAPVSASASKKPKITIVNCKTKKLTLKKGSKYALKVKVKPKKCKVTYKSSKGKIAKISKKGVIKALKKGKTNVTVIAKNGKKGTTKVKIKVTVVAGKGKTPEDTSEYVPVKDLSFSGVPTTLVVGTGGKLVISFNTKEEGAKQPSNKNVSFSSSDSKVLSVSEDGKVNAKKKGFANITVKSNSETDVSYTEAFAVFDAEEIKDSDGDGIPDKEEEYMGLDSHKKDEKIDFNKIAAKTVLTSEVKQINLSSDSVDPEKAKNEWDADYKTNRMKNRVVLPADTKVDKGELILINACKAYPIGASLRVSSVEKQSDGSLLVSGTVPSEQEVFEYNCIREELEPDIDSIIWGDCFKLDTKEYKKQKNDSSCLEAKAVKSKIPYIGELGAGVTLSGSITLSPYFNWWTPRWYEVWKYLDSWIDIGVQIDIDCKLSGHLDFNKKFHLFDIRAFGAGSKLAGASIPVDLIISASGEVSLSYNECYRLGFCLGVDDKDNGRYSETVNDGSFDFDGSFEGSVKIEAGIEAGLCGFIKGAVGGNGGVYFDFNSSAHDPIKLNNRFSHDAFDCKLIKCDFKIAVFARLEIELPLDIFDEEWGVERVLLTLPIHTWHTKENGRMQSYCGYIGDEPGLYDNDSGELIKTWEELTYYDELIQLENNGTSLKRVDFNIEGSLRLPNTITDIQPAAIRGCKNLIGILIPGSVKTIGGGSFNNSGGVFSGCKELRFVYMEEGVEALGNFTFIDCPKLFRVELPNTLVSLGSHCFCRCSGLNKLFLPASVTEFTGGDIETSVFDGVLEVYYPGDRMTIMEKFQGHQNLSAAVDRAKENLDTAKSKGDPEKRIETLKKALLRAQEKLEEYETKCWDFGAFKFNDHVEDVPFAPWEETENNSTW